ncbi:MAG: ornithine carbamoyltransferase [Candidatus Thermoplasmatota archaeon]|nr:ornithine carbamoyltransferase [Candidatus Thermoplasmatota archaeon]
MKRDLLSAFDMKDDLEQIIDLSINLKKRRYDYEPVLARHILGMIFEKQSTRTRVSLETAIEQLGGHAIYLNPNDMQVGRGETVADTARVLSGFVDFISYRAYSSENVAELARNASVPVINALDNKEHPVQIVADFMTMKEKFGKLKGLKLAYVGDGNNMANSLIAGASILGVDVSVGAPHGHKPDSSIVQRANELAKKNGSKVEILDDPMEAAENADAVYTDVWVSMGEEAEKKEKERQFSGFQVNDSLMSKAKKSAIFMHCLPAHRGLEVSASVIDGPRSIVFQQAENRLHTAKAILLTLHKSMHTHS